MSTFQVHILAADCAFYEGPCESIVVPTVQGQYGILAHHGNMIGAIIPGKMSYRIPGEETQYVAVSAGMVKIEDNEVLILADSIERPEEIDANRARRAADEAKEAMLQKRSIQEYHCAQAHLARAINRLRVKNSFDNK